MSASNQQSVRGTTESIRVIPCEDIVIRFPIPEPWIYIFREERSWGVGSVHSKMRKAGRVKNLKVPKKFSALFLFDEIFFIWVLESKEITHFNHLNLCKSMKMLKNKSFLWKGFV